MVTRRAVLRLERPAFTRTATLELDGDEIYVEEVTTRSSGTKSSTSTLSANGPAALHLLFDEHLKGLIERGYVLQSDEQGRG